MHVLLQLHLQAEFKHKRHILLTFASVQDGKDGTQHGPSPYKHTCAVVHLPPEPVKEEEGQDFGGNLNNCQDEEVEVKVAS